VIQNYRQLKNRIKSIDNTRKITRAMEMVSAAKLNRVKGAFFSSKPYSSQMERILFNFLSDVEPARHPLLEEREEKHATTLMVVASDTGLCSTYNHSIIKTAMEFADKFDKGKLNIVAVGKEAFSYFRRETFAIENYYLGLRGKFSENTVSDITKTLEDLFLTRSSDEIYVAYTHFSPHLKHEPLIEKFLPVEYARKEKQYYILEPEREVILNDILSRYLLQKVRLILLDSLTAEHSARMLAMKLATDNADELIDTLTLLKNKARQSAITKEVLEIAMSAEALKG
jgi:F-type H+-transporting ATPase subunit gamma